MEEIMTVRTLWYTYLLKGFALSDVRNHVSPENLVPLIFNCIVCMLENGTLARQRLKSVNADLNIDMNNSTKSSIGK